MAKHNPAGYSGTPLIKKLGVKPGYQCLIFNEPAEYWSWLSPLPEKVKVKKIASGEELDFIHVFVKEKKIFEKEFLKNKKLLKKDGTFWISWPKKSSKVPTDLDENSIRDFGLANGLVDVKVCAVDEVWSGLKFMFRIKDR
ncbi:MAG TPA: DUF3052 domain-containing protein [Cyclobacteriaceae bacterium]